MPIFTLEGTTPLIEIVANAAHCDVSAVVECDLHLIPAEPAAVVGIAGDFIASSRAKLIGAVFGLDRFIEAEVPKTGLIGVALIDSDFPNGSMTGMILIIFKELSVGPEFKEKLFVLGNENVPPVGSSVSSIAVGSECYYKWIGSYQYMVDQIALYEFVEKMERGGEAGSGESCSESIVGGIT
jgi:hypothetical protein